MSGFGGNGGWRPEEVIDLSRRAGTRVLRHLKWIVVGVVVLIAGLTTTYQVEPAEVGILTRFGMVVRTSDPGLHFRIPFGVDRVVKVPVQRQLKQEFGFRTTHVAVRSEHSTGEESKLESMMLTGDLNVATVEWIVQFKIRDPYKYLYRVRNVNETFRNMSEATMRQVIGDHGITEVLTIGREQIQVSAKQKLQELCDRYDTGIQVLQLVLQDVNPPEPVRPSFNEVNQAIQERERHINEAWAEYNRVIPEARGKAAQALQAAEGYATERVNRSKGEVARFLSLQGEYAKAPQVTRTRLYQETLAEILPAAGPRILLDPSLKGLVPLLSLGDGKVSR
jgi:membrane protease subunit HflK